MDHTFCLAIHGGAGTLRRDAMTPALEAAHRAGLRAALLAGHAVLAIGGTALDAVTGAVAALEDDVLFNAGRGAVFTSEVVSVNVVLPHFAWIMPRAERAVAADRSWPGRSIAVSAALGG